MRRASVIGIGMLWLGSLVATATIVWHLASRHFAAEPAPAGPVSDVRQVSAAETRPRDTRETASMEDLERENAALRHEVEQSHAGEKDAENERLRLVLKQALRQVAGPHTRNDTISAAWRHGFEAMSRNRERGGIVAHFLDIVQRHSRFLIKPKQQEVGERRLRPFNHRGQDGLLAHIRIQEKRCIRSFGVQSMVGFGGSGEGTKAFTFSPTVDTVT